MPRTRIRLAPGMRHCVTFKFVDTVLSTENLVTVTPPGKLEFSNRDYESLHWQPVGLGLRLGAARLIREKGPGETERGRD